MIDLSRKLKIDNILGADNVASLLNEDDRNKIGCEVVAGYKDDRESRKRWEENCNNAMKLAMQVWEKKNTPWDKAANVKHPLLSTSALQFASRAYPTLIPNRNVVQCVVVGRDDGTKQSRASRISGYMNYQLLEEMMDWEGEMDRMLFTVAIVGSAFKKTYFSQYDDRCASELVMAKDLVVDYYTKKLEDAYRVTHIVGFRPNKVEERMRMGIFIREDLQDPAPKEGLYHQISQANGIAEGGGKKEHAPHIFLEQHTYLDLDGDGLEEPYIVTVHEDSEKVVRIDPRYSHDSIEYNLKDQIVRIHPDHYFTKYGFIPSPDGGYYDIGFGQLLGHINDTVNTIINQLIDAGTLATLGGGFISRGLKMKSGALRFAPGEWKPVDSTGDDIRKSMVPLPAKEPSNVLFTLLGTLVSSGERMASITDPMLGESPGTHVPAATTLALIEQGLKVFGGITKRLHRSLKDELRKIFKINKEYLDGPKYYKVVDVDPKTGEGQKVESVSRTDFQGDDTDVKPYSDPNMVSEVQKLTKVQALMPFIQDPDFDAWEIKRMFVDALQVPDADVILPPKKDKPDQELLMRIAEMELEKEKVAIKRYDAESRAINSRIEAVKLGVELNMEGSPEAVARSVEMYKAIEQEAEATSELHRQGSQQAGPSRGMENQPPNEGMGQPA